MSFLKKLFHPEFVDNFDQELTHNFFLFSTASVFISTLAIALVYFYFHLTAMALAQLITSISTVIAILIYYKKKSVAFPMQLVMCSFFISSVYRISKMGGIEAPAFYTLFLVPIYSGFVLGINWGIFWTAIYLLMALGFHSAVSWGYPIHSAYTSEALASARIYVIVFSNIVCMSLVYSIKYFIAKGKELLLKEKEERSHLLKIISHDIAAPLTSLSLSLQLAREKNSLEYLNKSFKALEVINAMIKDIKNYEAIKSGKQILVKRATTWGQIFEELLFINNDSIKNKKINLVLPTNHLEDFIYTDQNIFVYQILNNILNNAIKFSYAESKIEITLKQENNSYAITIKDNGIGIPKDLLKNIYSLNIETTRLGTSGEKGTGFGLPIVKSYIEILGGSIHIESISTEVDSVKHGTSITVYLPA